MKNPGGGGMDIKIYQIDAFARKLFQGNPAAVCPLDAWLPDEVLQNIAAENNLSETAFFVPQDGRFHIRWFTPTTEVNLCGHATLAAAHVIFNVPGHAGEEVVFTSLNGELPVRKRGEYFELNFPDQSPAPCAAPADLLKAFDRAPMECLKSEDYLLLFEDENAIRNANPDMKLLRSLDLRGVIITATGASEDFVCRFFAPKFGIDEDPVTGSAYTQLAPYWARKLGKTSLTARQLSKRGGELLCRVEGGRVFISGMAQFYMSGTIRVEW